ncbi:MAG: ABC transporter ATP-binding protein, partial [Proteobacteria bacterium]|nr:ABC transporter ATP-binding protein [Pseudomonadota bacterium]
MSTPRSDWSMFRDLLPFLRNERWLYLAALAMAPASAVLVVMQPYLLKRAIDDTIRTHDVE